MEPPKMSVFLNLLSLLMNTKRNHLCYHCVLFYHCFSVRGILDQRPVCTVCRLSVLIWHAIIWSH